MAERDLEEVLRRMSQTKVNRRGFLAAAGLAGTAAFLAACGPSGRQQPAAPASAARLRSAAPSAAAVDSAAPSFEIEKELFMYNWAAVRQPGEHGRVQGASSASRRSPTTSTPTTRCCWPSSRAARPATTSRRRPRNTCPGWCRRASSRSSTCRASRTSPTSTRRSRACGGTRPTSTSVPKDYGTTGILYMKSLISRDPAVVEGVLRRRSRARPRARPSSSTRWGTSSSSRSRCSATPLTPSIRPSSTRRGPSCSTSRRTSTASTRTRTRSR